MTNGRFLYFLVLVSALAGCTASGSQSSTATVLLAQSSTSAPCHRPCVVAQYALPNRNSMPRDITAGPDGKVWFTEFSRIGNTTTNGTVTEYGNFPPDTPLVAIVAGPDSNLWFTEYCNTSAGTCGLAPAIGRITTRGVITEFRLKPPVRRFLGDITRGPDGNLWFTDITWDTVGRVIASQIGKITIAGTITEFALRPTVGPNQIVAGPDGNLWFTEMNDNNIGRITTLGVVTEFPIPRRGVNSNDITVGPHGGDLWFTEYNPPWYLGRITTSGVITEFPVRFGAWNLAAGPDGNLWFTEFSRRNRIASSTLFGKVSEYKIPLPTTEGLYVTTGPDRNVWFTETDNRIGKLAL